VTQRQKRLEAALAARRRLSEVEVAHLREEERVSCLTSSNRPGGRSMASPQGGNNGGNNSFTGSPSGTFQFGGAATAESPSIFRFGGDSAASGAATTNQFSPPAAAVSPSGAGSIFGQHPAAPPAGIGGIFDVVRTMVGDDDSDETAKETARETARKTEDGDEAEDEDEDEDEDEAEAEDEAPRSSSASGVASSAASFCDSATALSFAARPRSKGRAITADSLGTDRVEGWEKSGEYHSSASVRPKGAPPNDLGTVASWIEAHVRAPHDLSMTEGEAGGSSAIAGMCRPMDLVEADDERPGRSLALVLGELCQTVHHWNSPRLDGARALAVLEIFKHDGILSSIVFDHAATRGRVDVAAVVLRGAVAGLQSALSRGVCGAWRDFMHRDVPVRGVSSRSIDSFTSPTTSASAIDYLSLFADSPTHRRRLSFLLLGAPRTSGTPPSTQWTGCAPWQ
jgi:hypothetical protein